MFQRKIRAGVLIVWGIATLGATPNSADAGLLDRLFPLRAQRRAQRQALRQAQRLSEATTAYYPVTTAVGRNGRVCGQPVQQQVVVRYMPQVRYRTVWASVPVTVYRPTTSSNPATGCTVTCMRPCTTYTWQARRVPYTAYQPLYTTYTTVAVTTPAPVILGGQCSTASYTQGGAFSSRKVLAVSGQVVRIEVHIVHTTRRVRAAKAGRVQADPILELVIARDRRHELELVSHVGNDGLAQGSDPARSLRLAIAIASPATCTPSITISLPRSASASRATLRIRLSAAISWAGPNSLRFA